MRLCECLLHDQSNDSLQFLAGHYLRVTNLAGDGGQVVRCDLVQKALDPPLQLCLPALGHADPVSVGGGSRQYFPRTCWTSISAVPWVPACSVAASLPVHGAVAAEHSTVRGVVIDASFMLAGNRIHQLLRHFVAEAAKSQYCTEAAHSRGRPQLVHIEADAVGSRRAGRGRPACNLKGILILRLIRRGLTSYRHLIHVNR
mmetsp:Transcript_57713/g.150332  ORF Transcript_57713/g.150332 Transcript_57713/m.150332 type:complete len:201 (-) Transcript_57713:790-1392(-)